MLRSSPGVGNPTVSWLLLAGLLAGSGCSTTRPNVYAPATDTGTDSPGACGSGFDTGLSGTWSGTDPTGGASWTITIAAPTTPGGTAVLTLRIDGGGNGEPACGQPSVTVTATLTTDGSGHACLTPSATACTTVNATPWPDAACFANGDYCSAPGTHTYSVRRPMPPGAGLSMLVWDGHAFVSGG